MTDNKSLAALYARHLIPTYSPSLALVRGRGTRVWDTEGKVYLDFTSGIAVLNVGHCHPRVVEAVRRQAGELMHASNLFYTEPQALLASRLNTLTLGGKCFFCNSGAEANEAMIKLARLYGQSRGRFGIIAMQNSFHGRTLAALAATGQTKYQAGFEPMPEGFVHVPFNDLDAVRAAVNDKTAAILVEAVQGEGGVIPASPSFLQGLRTLCDEQDILLLFDEVQCGLGRTGHWFGYQASGISPDAFSLAKSLGGGLPIGALVASPKVADLFQPGKHASTFGGNPVACAAALAVLSVLEEEQLVTRAADLGTRFRARLETFVGRYPHVTGVRGLGFMIGLVLDEPVKPIVEKLRDKGLLTIATAETVIRLLPPLTVKESELDEAFEILEETLAEHHGMPLPEDV
jgi:acetylornithine/N-succinyldiaminopimelate aminotransferase